jgi:hypothetical protein
MTALAADTTRVYDSGVPRVQRDSLVKASTTIYNGSALCLEQADGYARPVAASLTAPVFLGFALEEVVNSGASGTKRVRTISQGVLTVPLAGVTGATAVTDIGATVYMADDGSGLTLTSTNNVAIGKIMGLVDGFLMIFFQAGPLRSL